MTIAKGGFEKAGLGTQEFPWTLDRISDETFTRVKGEIEDEVEDEIGRCEKW